jgi:CRISPR-associated Csx2 family protein
MGRKVFLSFLGTGNYKSCRYVSEEFGESEVVEFVQDALVQLVCRDFTAGDVVYIFLTEESERKHWSSLSKILDKSGLSVVAVKDIPEAYSESEIWELFTRIFNVLKSNDEVILDITHGFRSLPMLAMVLLSYAKALKNIKVRGVYYGAFEALGPSFSIDDFIPDPTDRRAPVIDLTAFASLQDWTYSARNFVSTGKPSSIADLTLKNIEPVLRNSRGTDKTAFRLRQFVKSLSLAEREISTNRGKNLLDFPSMSNAKNNLQEILKDPGSVLPPLLPILEVIFEKVEVFNSSQYENWEACVDWCIKHGLEQQGITQLQEGIITFICKRNRLNAANLIDREIVSQSLNIFSKNINYDDWNSPARDHKEVVETVINDPFVQSHKANYDRLSELRNDINHGGYKKNSISSPEKIALRLEEIFVEFRKISQNP